MTTIHLLLLAGVVSLLAPRLLRRAEWVYRAPGLGLAAWYAVLATVTGSALGALAGLGLQWPRTRDAMCAWWVWCVDALRGGHGTVGRIAGWVVLAALAAIAGRLAITGWRLALSMSRRRRAHVQMLALVGRYCPQLDATVVEHSQPAAYVLAGWSPRIVVTRGAVESLPAAQLAAVLAHERAHAAGRHHLLLSMAWLLAEAFPRIAVFGHAHRQIDRLVEVRADEVATGQHERLNLARALVTLAEAASVPAMSMPVGAIAATGGDTLERVHRLLTPPPPLARRSQGLIVASLLVLPVLPVALVAATMAFPMLGLCLPIGG